MGRFAAVAVLLLGSCASPSAGPSARPPNIVLILADDLGYGDVGCYNPESKVLTPHLDRLGAQGVRLVDAHSPSTVCTPSRYSILTGRMCFRNGFKGVFTGVDGPLLEPGRLTIAQLLRRKGYATSFVGKWHVGMTFFKADGTPVAPRGGGVDKVRQVDFSRPVKDGPLDAGFDSFFGTVCCPTTDWLYAYIDGDRVTQAPTELVRPRGGEWTDYEHFRAGLKAPDFDFRKVDLVFLEKSLAFLERQRPDRPFFLFHSAQAVHLPALPDERFVGKTKAGPLGDFIFEFDHVVGELVGALDRLGLGENTLVVVTSDNGPEVVLTRLREDFGHDSARPWRGMKRDNWEGGHRVPFLARWPGRIPAGTVSGETVCLTDLFATFASAAGAEIPSDAAEDSADILPVLLGKAGGRPVREYTLHQTISNELAIRSGPWKYLDHRGSGGNRYDGPALRKYALPETDPAAAAQLYHLGDDPGETRNVIGRNPEVAARLKERLEQFKSSGRSVERR